MKLFGKGLRIGRISRWLSPRIYYWQWCQRCKTTWFWSSAHVTKYSTEMEAGSNPLCEKCWSELTPKDRLPYYRREWAVWKGLGLFLRGKLEDIWVQLKTAVMLGN